jgi:cytochrome b561
LFLGARGLAHIPNADPLKIAALRAHMAGGLIILTLMCIRLVVRSVTKRPPPASTGSVALDSIAWFSHRALYLAAIAMPVTGLIMAVQSGVIGVLLRKAIVVPADFWVYPIRSVHYVLSRTLMVLIAVHISGALYHTIIRRDGLLKRMSLRLRRAGPS